MFAAMTEKRTTSAAKEYLTPREESLLETYGVARNHFEHARDPTIAQQHIDLAQDKAAEDARAERGSILANGGARLPEVNDNAERGKQPDNARDGSKMVQDDRPKLEARPTEDMARAVDKEAFDKKWFEEQHRAREQNNERDQDRGYDR